MDDTSQANHSSYIVILHASKSAGKDHPRAVRDVCPIADHRAPDGGVPHAAAPGDEAISTSGMTAEEDKKTPARVGRVPGLILCPALGTS